MPNSSALFATMNGDGLRIIAGDNVWLATMEADGLTLRRIEPEGMIMSEMKAEYETGERDPFSKTSDVGHSIFCANEPCPHVLAEWYISDSGAPFLVIAGMEITGQVAMRCRCGKINVLRSDDDE